MQVVVGTSSLARAGGTETYSVTVADHLQRLGHDVWLYSPELGEASASAERLGVRVVGDVRGLPAKPHGLIVQDAVVSYELAAALPWTPQVFAGQSDSYDLQIPPQVPGVVEVIVTMYDRVDQRIRALGLPCEIVRMKQPVDVDRFKPHRAPRREAPVGLMLSNYVHGQRLELLTRACARAGVELRHVGGYSPDGQRPSDVVINEADIVFGKARVIHEAMACGRAAYVFDHNGGDGWVTPENYETLVADNFGGQSLPEAIDEDRLVRDLGQYDPDMGIANRDLMVANHAATKHAAALVDVLRRLPAREAPVDAPLTEMARLVRLYHRADSQAFSLRAEFDRLGAQAHELGVELLHARSEVTRWRAYADGVAAGADLERTRREHDELRERIAQLELELAETTRRADAHAAEAADAARQRDAVTRTRRWRTVQALLVPADRLRKRRSRVANS